MEFNARKYMAVLLLGLVASIMLYSCVQTVRGQEPGRQTSDTTKVSISSILKQSQTLANEVTKLRQEVEEANKRIYYMQGMADGLRMQYNELLAKQQAEADSVAAKKKGVKK